MKKLISGVLILATVICLLTSVTSAVKFSDISGKYYESAVEALSEFGILNGYADGTFGGRADITRSEMATVICRMLGYENEAKKSMGKTDYKDVPSDYWASGYINVATKYEIIGGDGDGNFRPEDNVLYEEAVKMVVCAVGYGDKAIKNGGWYKGYLKVAESLGILDNLKGKANEYSIRGEIALMVYNGLSSVVTDVKINNISETNYGTQTISLDSSNKDVSIYYTLNGKDPTKYGVRYKGSFDVYETCELRVVASINGAIFGDVFKKQINIIRISADVASYYSFLSFDMSCKDATNIPSSQKIRNNRTAIRPEDPKRVGYKFVNWYTDNNFTKLFDFENTVIYENRTIYAKWAEASYKLEFGQILGGTVNSSVAGEYKEGAEITLTFTPAEHYRFKSWSATAGVFKDATLLTTTFRMPGKDVVITTLSDKYTTITLNTVTGGSVTGFDTSTKEEIKGTQLTLTAVPETGYAFTSWYCDKEGVIADKTSISTTITFIDEDAVIYPVFSTTYPKLIAEENVIGGSIVLSQTGYFPQGTVITITATPNTDYYLKEWKIISGNATITDPKALQTTLIMPNSPGDVVVGAVFEKKYTLQISVTEGGNVNTEVQGKYFAGEIVNIIATPITGYKFKGWTCNIDGAIEDINAENTKITILQGSSDITVTANFEKTFYLLGTSSSGGTISSGANSYYESGKEVSITATPDEGYVFDSWITASDGVVLSSTTSKTATFKMPAGEVSIHAVFTVDYSKYYLILNKTSTKSGDDTFYTFEAVECGTKKLITFGGTDLSNPLYASYKPGDIVVKKSESQYQLLYLLNQKIASDEQDLGNTRIVEGATAFDKTFIKSDNTNTKSVNCSTTPVYSITKNKTSGKYEISLLPTDTSISYANKILKVFTVNYNGTLKAKFMYLLPYDWAVSAGYTVDPIIYG